MTIKQCPWLTGIRPQEDIVQLIYTNSLVFAIEDITESQNGLGWKRP